MNLTFLARQITNVVATTATHINDDRVFFGMQLARRLPGPASRFVGRVLGRTRSDAAQAASAWLLGRETKAKTLVANSVHPSRLLGEIALNLGLLDEAESHRRSGARCCRTEFTHLVDQRTARPSPSTCYPQERVGTDWTMSASACNRAGGRK